MVDIKTLDGTSVTMGGAAIAALRSNLRGGVVLADDPGYDTARRVWNGNIDRRPALIARCTYANIGMYQRMKNLTWLADSRSNVKSFPAGVQDDIGYALYAAQLGERSVKAKPLRGLGGQVMEIVAYHASGTYRAIYTVSIGESIYVIHAFQKKSKAGVATPKSEMELIRQRIKQLRSEVKNAEKRGP